MARPKRLRRIVEPPAFKGYKPYGVNQTNNDVVDLLYEEYEALKLADYDRLDHLEASKLMGVSRPTFARIYESARRKIAQALVEVTEIKTVFGHAQFDKDWFHCRDCHARFSMPETAEEEGCPLCHSENTTALQRRSKPTLSSKTRFKENLK